MGKKFRTVTQGHIPYFITFHEYDWTYFIVALYFVSIIPVELLGFRIVCVAGLYLPSYATDIRWKGNRFAGDQTAVVRIDTYYTQNIR